MIKLSGELALLHQKMSVASMSVLGVLQFVPFFLYEWKFHVKVEVILSRNPSVWLGWRVKCIQVMMHVSRLDR